MRFYRGQHTHYCGVDLHTRTMYLCILVTQTGSVAAQHAGQSDYVSKSS